LRFTADFEGWNRYSEGVILDFFLIIKKQYTVREPLTAAEFLLQNPHLQYTVVSE